MVKVEGAGLEVEPFYRNVEQYARNVEQYARNVERAYLIRQFNEECRILHGKSRTFLPESRNFSS